MTSGWFIIVEGDVKCKTPFWWKRTESSKKIQLFFEIAFFHISTESRTYLRCKKKIFTSLIEEFSAGKIHFSNPAHNQLMFVNTKKKRFLLIYCMIHIHFSECKTCIWQILHDSKVALHIHQKSKLQNIAVFQPL